MTLEAMHHNGSGVAERVPAQPKTTRTLLPSSWLQREVELTFRDGGSTTGTLLDLCPMGPVLAVSLSAAETTRRVASWDAIRFVDLRE